MDALLRGRRLLLSALSPTTAGALTLSASVAFAAGCHGAPLEGVGRAADVPVTSTPPQAVPVTPPPVAPDYATRLARIGPDSFVSWGHAGGRYAATVYVTPAVKATLFHDVAPPGTEIVMATVDGATHAAGPTFFMRRDSDAGSSWQFGTFETHGGKNPGLALCARCHAEAPSDGIFALPE